MTLRSWSLVRPRNGPPLAVSTMRATSDARPPRRHCHTAECSESTGTISPPPAARALATTGPAAIRLSLFASASRLPARSDASVAGRPAKPTTAFNTTSASGCAASVANTSGSSAHARRQVGRHVERARLFARAARCCGRRPARRRGTRRGGGRGRRALAYRSSRSSPGSPRRVSHPHVRGRDLCFRCEPAEEALGLTASGRVPGNRRSAGRTADRRTGRAHRRDQGAKCRSPSSRRRV